MQLAARRSALALDIGGANLKLAHSDGTVRQEGFKLWQHPGGLADALGTIALELPVPDTIVIAMTGELCDCYRSKAEGVRHILESVDRFRLGLSRDARCWVWRCDCSWCGIAQAAETPDRVAATNWLAEAAWIGKRYPTDNVLLIDVGSTTTDIVPIQQGIPCAAGSSDFERLRCAELVYTGWSRTPVAALLAEVEFAGRCIPLASEYFATAGDAYLVLGHQPEQPDNCETADARPATARYATARLARMLCSDPHDLPRGLVQGLAEEVLAAQRKRIGFGIKTVIERVGWRPDTVFLTGEGEWLGAAAWASSGAAESVSVLSGRNTLGTEASRAACAVALLGLAPRE